MGGAPVLREEIPRPSQPGGKVPHLARIPAPEGANGIAIAVIDLQPLARKLAEAIAEGADIPGFGDQPHPRQHGIRQHGLEEGAHGIEFPRLPRQSDREIEAETIHLHLGDPVAQGIEHQSQAVGVIQIDTVATAGHVGVTVIVRAMGPGLEGVVTRVVEPFERQHGAIGTGFGGVVVDHIQYHLEPGTVQLAHHGLELGHCLSRAITRLRGEEGNGVVAPVVGQPKLFQPRLRHEGGHRHQLHRGDPQRQQVFDHQRMADAEVGAPQRLGHPGMLTGEALDVGLVEHDPLGRDARLADPLPVEGIVHHHRLGHHGRAVPLIEVVIPTGRPAERPGIGVDQQLVGVEQHALLGRAMDPVTVTLTSLHPAHITEAVLTALAGQGQPDLLLLLLVEQTEFHLVRLRGPDAEVAAGLVEPGPQRVVHPIFHYKHQDSCLMNKVASGGKSSTMLCAIPCQGVGSATKVKPTS